MNTDIRLKVGFFHHTKIVRLERRIGASGVLSLLRLFAYTAQNKPDGNLSGLDDEEIEIAAGWTGKQGEMIEACVGLRLLDKNGPGYVIHDWHTHQPWAAGAEKRSKQASDAAKKRWEKTEQKQPSNADSMQPEDSQHADSNAPSPSLTLPTKSLNPLSENKFTDEDTKLARWIFNLILALDGDRKEPNFNSWSDTIRLMRERDKLTHREIAEVFKWANNDSFWQANILSVSKLREKFSDLKIKMTNSPVKAKVLTTSEQIAEVMGHGMDGEDDGPEHKIVDVTPVGFLAQG